MSLNVTSFENRKFGTRLANLNGWVTIPGRPPVACAIRNMNDHGALLIFDQMLRLPENFVLSLEGSKVTHRCVVRQNFVEKVAVGFTDADIDPAINVEDFDLGAWSMPAPQRMRR